MSKIKTNERELASQVAIWFNEHIKRNEFAFTSATNETGISTTDATRFGDIVIWKNRETNSAYSYIELKPPAGAKENLETFRQKAIQLNISFAFTWDFQTLNVYRVEKGKIALLDSEATPVLNSIEEWLRGDKQTVIKTYIQRICIELVKLHETGKFNRFQPEKIYFIHLIRSIVQQLTPLFEIFIREKNTGTFKDKINKYVIEQGISYPSDEEFYRIIARQRVYGLVTKIIFYLTIRRYFKDLPDLIETDEQDLNAVVKLAFAEAGKKDWQAVFLDDPVEELGFPEHASHFLKEFFTELRVYHFGELKEDVIAELFEEIIDPNERHALGQYFTREDLVDFIIGLVVTDKDGTYADPTCGSGTFLIRLYDRLKYLSNFRKQHTELLNQIWGVDIGKFPAELSTINLFRQQVSNFENFPRVLHKSIFDIRKNFVTEFPPHNAGFNYSKVKVPLPEFNGFVGNFPYIRQELIEKKDKGFKNELTKLLAEEYLFSYPKLFVVKKNLNDAIDELKKKPQEKIASTIDELVENDELSLRLSGQADIYTYIFIHTTTLLAQHGSFAIITSNSWLDVAYGSVLKEFFLDHFKIKSIIASWAEPWFEDASVNTVVSVLEKEENAEQRKNNTVHFVKLKKKFTELIPFRNLQLESINRWQCVDGLVRSIENAESHKKYRKVTESISSLETDEMRIRMIAQGELEKEVAHKNEMSKWGKYLRAPDVYFDLLETCKGKLVPLKNVADVRRGYTTGINEFFYLEKIGDAVDDIVRCRNDRGWEGNLEEKYLRKVIKSPRESDSIIIDPEKLKYYIFICNKSKEELEKAGDLDVLNYIEWGEKQKTEEGVKWMETASVKGRTLWYNLGIETLPDFIIPCGIGDSYKVYNNNHRILNDKRLYEIYNTTKKKFLLENLNCTLFGFFEEAESRVSLGDGLLDLTVYEVEEIRIASPKIFKPKQRTALKKALSKISKRPIKSIFEEVKQKDRHELDTAVLEALGVDAKEYLPKIYEGMCEMVKERLELPKMRKKQKKEKEQFSYDEVRKSVVSDVIGKQMRRFPESFYEGEIPYSKLEFEIYTGSGGPLHKESFFTSVQLLDEKGKIIFTTDDPDVADCAVALSLRSLYQLPIPKDRKVRHAMASAWNAYIGNVEEQLKANARMKLHDWLLAEKMAKEILASRGIYFEDSSKKVKK